ncbi:MAG: transposase [Burkholderiaceae bacterium]
MRKCRIENQMRPVVLERKNWLFAGSLGKLSN